MRGRPGGTGSAERIRSLGLTLNRHRTAIVLHVAAVSALDGAYEGGAWPSGGGLCMLKRGAPRSPGPGSTNPRSSMRKLNWSRVGILLALFVVALTLWDTTVLVPARY